MMREELLANRAKVEVELRQRQQRTQRTARKTL